MKFDFAQTSLAKQKNPSRLLFQLRPHTAGTLQLLSMSQGRIFSSRTHEIAAAGLTRSSADKMKLPRFSMSGITLMSHTDYGWCKHRGGKASPRFGADQWRRSLLCVPKTLSELMP
jgi:hypothetical protein